MTTSAVCVTPAAPRAIVLVSGGVDSATVLAMAQRQGFECYAVSFDYGQRHHSELRAADAVTHHLGAKQHKTVKLDLRMIGGSALTDTTIDVPNAPTTGIPVTYVPARNTVFLAIALGWAEVVGASDLFIGVNAVDYSGYPDCRPAFISAFETLANVATKAGIEGRRFTVHAPLLNMTKADIIRAGIELGVDFGLTVSCYDADDQGRACGQCDSCRLRHEGFVAAAVTDPTRYR